MKPEKTISEMIAEYTAKGYTMYTKGEGDNIIGYRFGEPIEAMALWVDDGFKTSEEAFMYWYNQHKEKKQ